MSLLFWLLLVPLGVTGCANALNMSAGYNGLESGQIIIISSALLIISILDKSDYAISIIYAGIVGSSLALYMFNKYPAKIFVGDVGTLGLGSLIAASVIMGGHIIYGIICIIPTFYEFFSTIKYSLRKVERRGSCMNPVLLDSGLIKPPKGSEDYTLAFFLLSKFDLSEKSLVNRILSFYVICSSISLVLFYFFDY